MHLLCIRGGVLKTLGFLDRSSLSSGDAIPGFFARVVQLGLQESYARQIESIQPNKRNIHLLGDTDALEILAWQKLTYPSQKGDTVDGLADLVPVGGDFGRHDRTA